MRRHVTVEGVCGVALPVAIDTLPRWHQELLEHELAGSPPSRRKRQRSNGTTPPSRRLYTRDRFIPSRAATELDYAISPANEEPPPIESSSVSTSGYRPHRYCSAPSASPTPESVSIFDAGDPDVSAELRYKQVLASNLLLPLMSTSCASPSSVASHPSLRYNGRPLDAAFVSPSKLRRHMPLSPTRILDAPDLRDDYYLNLVSWGVHNVLAVALDQVVYLYNTDTGAIQEIRACTSRHDYVTSVAWARSTVSSRGPRDHRAAAIESAGAASSFSPAAGNLLAVGTSRGELQVWDTTTSTKTSVLCGHGDRIGALAWNDGTLTSGSRDAKILHYDLRARAPAAAVAKPLLGHHQEVCGLAWAPDGVTLASGGNDNCLCLWDNRMFSPASVRSNSVAPRQRLLQHNAAVKALAWCPWERHLLASGGGTADRTIKFWNASTSRLLQSVNTGSQVCGLVWSKTEKELLSSHGFSQHELCLWRYPSMTRVREFTGHTARVLHLAMSPDGSSVVSAAADETLRFWNVFSSAADTVGALSRHRSLFFPAATIR
ncbi:hypothetical protein P43SY_010122 [Pythium insidiosum]|uniref:CDC20/Fizzy WD40 domain-containing protein n=1 Tax=Pythium insidiosum TaxID=114742 RepID=A0AAD5LBD6_PYTIN|nr:hypothetical protein P43SY_010122 [Pythium insidiosum]